MSRAQPTGKSLSLMKRDSIVLIKGARQMGKTSLLARGMQFAREQGPWPFQPTCRSSTQRI